MDTAKPSNEILNINDSKDDFINKNKSEKHTFFEKISFESINQQQAEAELEDKFQTSNLKTTKFLLNRERSCAIKSHKVHSKSQSHQSLPDKSTELVGDNEDIFKLVDKLNFRESSSAEIEEISSVLKSSSVSSQSYIGNKASRGSRKINMKGRIIVGSFSSTTNNTPKSQNICKLNL